MNSGTYKINRLSCVGCMRKANNDEKGSQLPIIGWIYNKSYNQDYKWKEGKFILEVKFIVRESWVEKQREEFDA